MLPTKRAVALVIAIVGVIAIYSPGAADEQIAGPSQPSIQEERAAIPPRGIYTVVYSVGDLAVWHNYPKNAAATKEIVFDPSLLIAYIQSVVDPDSWKTAGSIRPFPTEASFVVTQSGANHKMLSSLLERLRDQADARFTAAMRTGKQAGD